MLVNELQTTVTPVLVADQVSKVLQNAVFTGELPAGRRLRVREVAEMVGTSVMPVREALRQLEQLGLVTSAPHRGTVVKEFSLSELIHIYDVRSLLETDATRRAVARVSDEGIHTMAHGCAQMQEAVADGRVSDALGDDELVLKTLYQAGGNPVLTSLIESLWTQCRAYKFIGATEAMQIGDQSLWTPQLELLEAVRARDVEAAALITERSLSSARRRLETRLRSRPPAASTQPPVQVGDAGDAGDADHLKALRETPDAKE